MNTTDSKALIERTARRSVWASVVVNLALAVMQITVGLFTHSQALVSDGVHSLSDLLSDIVALFATHFSRQTADDKHPYGHRRFENAASLALGLLLSVGGAVMVFSAVQKFYHPNLAPVHHSALWVAVIALIAKESLFRYMLAMAKKARSGLLIANAWHARSDAASSMVAIVGIIGSLLGVPLFDPLAALIVGAMVAGVGIKFAYHALQDLMDAAADDETLNRIKSTVITVSGVLGYHDLRTRKTGDDVFVDIHIEVARHLSVVEGHDIAVSVRNTLLNIDNIADVMVHIDPVKENE